MNVRASGRDQTSIAFISFHKCATSYFTHQVLPNFRGLNHIDYLRNLYRKNEDNLPGLMADGHVYGVLRIQEREHPRYDFVNQLFQEPAFWDMKHIFWTRDPRDILISSYYSFGFSHGFSKDPELAAYQKKRRDRYCNMTLNECVLKEAPKVREKFMHMKRLMDSSDRFIHLKYEEMVLHFDEFFDKLAGFAPLDGGAYEKLLSDSRPMNNEDQMSHRRSGAVGDYKNKLDRSTIELLDNELNDVLRAFSY